MFHVGEPDSLHVSVFVLVHDMGTTARSVIEGDQNESAASLSTSEMTLRHSSASRRWRWLADANITPPDSISLERRRACPQKGRIKSRLWPSSPIPRTCRSWCSSAPAPNALLSPQVSLGRSSRSGIRANARFWVAVLLDDPAGVAHRAREDRWSTLEYGCHVRDVFRVVDWRLNLMLTQDDPADPNWDQDRTALDDHYEHQDPATVAAELADAAEVLARDFEGVDATAWQRPGTRSDGARFTVETIGQYLLHDVVHHVGDVKCDLATST